MNLNVELFWSRPIGYLKSIVLDEVFDPINNVEISIIVIVTDVTYALKTIVN